MRYNARPKALRADEYYREQEAYCGGIAYLQYSWEEIRPVKQIYRMPRAERERWYQHGKLFIILIQRIKEKSAEEDFLNKSYAQHFYDKERSFGYTYAHLDTVPNVTARER